MGPHHHPPRSTRRSMLTRGMLVIALATPVALSGHIDGATTIANAAEPPQYPVPELLADVNQIGADSDPDDFVRLGDSIYFAAEDYQHGRELRRYDLNSGSITLVADLSKGPDSADPRWLTVFDDRIWFRAFTEETGIELFVSDGTEAGTDLVADIYDGPGSSTPRDFFVHDNGLVVSAYEPTTGREMWRTETDGTTYLIKDFDPSTGVGGGSRPVAVNEIDGSLYFRSTTDAEGAELFRLNGDDSFTTFDLTPGPDSTSLQQFRSIDNYLVFFAAFGTDRQVLEIKGSSTTADVRLFDPAATWLSIETSANYVYAAVRTPSGTDLHAFEPGGAPALLLDDGGDMLALSPFGDRLLFVHDEPATGREPWIADAAAGPGATAQLADIVDGADHPEIFNLSANADATTALFTARFDDGTSAIWTTDGTKAGTVFVLDGDPGFGYSYTPFDDQWIFGYSELDLGSEPWLTDGTKDGTKLIADINTATNPSYPYDFAPMDDRVVFTADDGVHGEELVSYDPTTAGLPTVHDLTPGPEGTEPFAMLPLGDRVTFASLADSSVSITDGSPAGTTELFPIEGADWAISNGSSAVYEYDDLWYTDGTVAGSEMILGVESGGGAFLDDLLIFEGDGPNGTEPWVSNGTAAGTFELDDLNPGSSSSSPRYFTEFGGEMFFIASGNLYRTGGVVGDVVEVPLPNDATARAIGTNETLLVVTLGGDGVAVSTDVSAGFTRLDVDGADYTIVRGTASSNDTVAFHAGGSNGNRLLLVNETSTEVHEFPAGTVVSEVVGHRDWIFVKLLDAATDDHSLWATPGQSADLQLIFERALGADKGIGDPTVIGDHLYFEAGHPEFGYEPWVAYVGPTPLVPQSVSAVPGDGEVTVSWSAADALGGADIVEYVVTASPGGASCTTTGALSCTITGLDNGTEYTFTVVASNPFASSASSTASAPVTPGPQGEFVPLDPARVYESRPGFSTVDGLQNATGRRTAGSTTVIELDGRAGLPTGATAVSLNVTAVFPDNFGYLTVYPCDSPQPDASNVNYTPGAVAPNAVLTKLSTTNTVCIYTLTATDLIVDINGAFTDGSGFEPLNPARVYESRPGFSTVDGQQNATGRRTAGSTTVIELDGRAGLPTGATAVSLNVTAVFPDNFGYLTVYPCDSPQPDASNVNYTPGAVAPNAVLTKLSTTNTVCIYTLTATDLIVDINGAFTTTP